MQAARGGGRFHQNKRRHSSSERRTIWASGAPMSFAPPRNTSHFDTKAWMHAPSSGVLAVSACPGLLTYRELPPTERRFTMLVIFCTERSQPRMPAGYGAASRKGIAEARLASASCYLRLRFGRERRVRIWGRSHSAWRQEPKHALRQPPPFGIGIRGRGSASVRSEWRSSHLREGKRSPVPPVVTASHSQHGHAPRQPCAKPGAKTMTPER